MVQYILVILTQGGAPMFSASQYVFPGLCSKTGNAVASTSYSDSFPEHILRSFVNLLGISTILLS
jgi:hypothetical protein